LIIISYKIERKNGKKLFNTFEISKNIVSIFSGRILIGQNDSFDVLLLNDFFCDFKKVEMTWLMDINCNAISKLFAGFLNFVTTRPRGWIHKTVLLLFHKVFSFKMIISNGPLFDRSRSSFLATLPGVHCHMFERIFSLHINSNYSGKTFLKSVCLHFVINVIKLGYLL